MKQKLTLVGSIFMLLITSYGQTNDNISSLRTTIIGSQVWMVDNLNVSKYRNGENIPQVKDMKALSQATSGAWCYYENDPANGAKYGKLYNWLAVVDSRGLAPVGFHIPTSEEAGALFVSSTNTSVSSKLLKSKTGWDGNGNGNNESGFNAFPGGFFNGAIFVNKGKMGVWWTSDEFNQFNARYIEILGSSDTPYGAWCSKNAALSVRCVKDVQANSSNANSNISNNLTSTNANSKEIIGLFQNGWGSDGDEFWSADFKGEDGKDLHFTLANELDKTVFCDYQIDGEEKTVKVNVGKKYKINYLPNDYIEGSLGQITSYQEITDNGAVQQKPKTGTVLNDVDDLYMQERKLSNKDGAIIEKVTEGGAAAEAGILIGDVFLSINGEKINGAQNMVNKILTYKPGDKITVLIIRNGAQITKEITLK